MNEENFHEDHPQQVPTPEEEQPQGEKKEGGSMKKLIYALLAVAVLALVVVACAPMVMDNQAQTGTSESAEGAWDGGSFVSHDVTIRWYPDNVEGRRITLTEWSADEMVCHIGFSPDFLQTADPGELAWMAGYCFYHMDMARSSDFNTPEDSREYAQFYSDTYSERCGETYEPFAWNDASDGACELPHPQEVSDAFFAQDG